MKIQSKLSTWVAILIILIQLFDVLIHAATDQLEPLRVVSNLVIIIWVLVLLSGKVSKIMPVALGSIGIYLCLNIIFLTLEGVTNPNQGDELRVTLFLLLFLTTTFSSVLFFQQKVSQ